jgi:hypothetical protein
MEADLANEYKWIIGSVFEQSSCQMFQQDSKIALCTRDSARQSRLLRLGTQTDNMQMQLTWFVHWTASALATLDDRNGNDAVRGRTGRDGELMEVMLMSQSPNRGLSQRIRIPGEKRLAESGDQNRVQLSDEQLTTRLTLTRRTLTDLLNCLGRSTAGKIVGWYVTNVRRKPKGAHLRQPASFRKLDWMSDVGLQ